MTVKEAAEKVGRTEQTVRLWIKKHKIHCDKNISGKLIISSHAWAKFCADNNIERSGE